MPLEDTVTALTPQLLRYCLARTGDVSLAEDIAQDAMTALVSRWRRFGTPDSPAAFVFSIARRRAARAGARRFVTEPLEAVLGHSAEGPTPERQTELTIYLEAVRGALVRISAKEREALLLISAGELSTRDAAAALGVSESAVKMRVKRARAHLREILELQYESA